MRTENLIHYIHEGENGLHKKGYSLYLWGRIVTQPLIIQNYVLVLMAVKGEKVNEIIEIKLFLKSLYFTLVFFNDLHLKSFFFQRFFQDCQVQRTTGV